MTNLINKNSINMDLLDCIISDPMYLKRIQELSAKTLTNLIEKVGLEESGELILLATPKQLEDILDNLMWSYQDGKDFETFSYDKFYQILESIFVTQKTAITDKIQEFDENILLSALDDTLMVLEIDDLHFRMRLKEDGYQENLIDKVMDTINYLEVDKYIIFSKEDTHWDLLATIISELNESDYSYLDRLLQRLCTITSDYIEDNGGLYQVLKEREQLFEDMAGDREDRRRDQGYVSGAEAKAFFKSFEDLSPEEIIESEKYSWTEKSYMKNNKESVRGPKKVELIGMNNEIASTVQDDFSNHLLIVKNDNVKLYTQLLMELTFLANIQVEYNKCCQKEIKISEDIETMKDNILKGMEYCREEGISKEDISQKYGLIKLFKLGQVLNKHI